MMFKHRPGDAKYTLGLERSVLAAGLLLTLLPLACFYGDFELYPFAPYSMYSHPFTLPHEDFILEAVTKDNARLRIVSFNKLDQSFLESLIYSFKDDSPAVRKELELLSQNCKAADCVKFSNNEAVLMSNIRSIRAVKRVFNTVTALAHQQPETAHTLAEISLE